jgi:hypothetical protein
MFEISQTLGSRWVSFATNETIPHQEMLLLPIAPAAGASAPPPKPVPMAGLLLEFQLILKGYSNMRLVHRKSLLPNFLLRQNRNAINFICT